MKFEIKSNWTGAVIFTADIDCDDGASHGINLGFAVKVAVNAGADLAGADLNGITGLNDWIKCIQIEEWPITYTDEEMQIGCQRHPIALWETFSDAEIRAMDGRKAVAFWSKWKAWIFQAIEMAPAKPTAPVESEVVQ